MKQTFEERYTVNGKYQFTHTEIDIFMSKREGYGGAFILKWSCDKLGFGELTFYMKNNKLHCDTECMSEEFIKQALEYHLTNNTTFRHI